MSPKNDNRPYNSQLDKIEGKLFEKAEVNGTEMLLRWNTEFDTYTLYFPQMEIKGHPMDADEEIIEISPDEDKAKQVLEFAKKLALNETNVHEIYRKVGTFARSLDLETVESQAQDTRKKVRHLSQSANNENEAAA